MCHVKRHVNVLRETPMTDPPFDLDASPTPPQVLQEVKKCEISSNLDLEAI